MEKFEVTILGCGSALPTTRHLASCQVVNFRDKLFMIDCGEGAQLQLRKSKLKFSRLTGVFISHLHGDHCFGLIGLLSTLGMLGRTGDFYVYAHRDAERIFQPQLDYFCQDLGFRVIFKAINPSKNELIYEDRALKVYTIPLKHRVPTCGFLFEEKQKERHLKNDMIKFWNIPLKDLHSIKEGNDWISPTGDRVMNKALTRDAEPARKYAYCSDTAYSEKVVEMVKGVDLLYHEATFAQTELARAKETQHTTASQAGMVAARAGVKKLVIGHFSARYENEDVLLKEASAEFNNVVLAREGLMIWV